MEEVDQVEIIGNTLKVDTTPVTACLLVMLNVIHACPHLTTG